MNQLYEHPQHYVAVDCVILGYGDGELKLLLYPRAFTPKKGEWSLMGGFLQEGEELSDAAKRVLFIRAGLDDIYLEEVGCFSAIDRDPASRVISVAYYALVNIENQDVNKLAEHGSQWWSINDLPDMIFDHREMVAQAMDKLQTRANELLLGKELLPELFTLLQLRNVYQAIFRRPLELANFRKKILSLDILEKQDIKNKTESRKGAFYYTFKPEANNRVLDRIVKLT